MAKLQGAFLSGNTTPSGGGRVYCPAPGASAKGKMWRGLGQVTFSSDVGKWKNTN